jgi:hypothetical protein
MGLNDSSNYTNVDTLVGIKPVMSPIHPILKNGRMSIPSPASLAPLSMRDKDCP